MAQNACTKFTDNYELKEELGKKMTNMGLLRQE